MADDVPSNTLQPIVDVTVPTSTTDAAAQSARSALPNDILQEIQDAAAAAGTLTPSAAAGTGTATPLSGISDMPLTAEQRSLSLKVSLADLVARASGHWAQKRYEEAAEVYAQAAEMQAEMNGEMAIENAEVLFLYGRSLFKVGQEKSDVLGGRAPTTEEQQTAAAGGRNNRKAGGKKTGKKGAAAGSSAAAAAAAAAAADGQEEERTTKDAAAAVAEEAAKIAGEGVEAANAAVSKELEGKKPLFQFTGDENWDDSDEEAEGEDEEEAEGGEGDEDEEELDDLGSAFEILDLARVFFNKQLEAKLAALHGSSGESKGKEVENGEGENSDASIRHIKERLTEIYDRLAEISLENERFPRAISDMREALRLTQDLVPDDNERTAEAHFKLSLALEFGSITTQRNEDGSEGSKEINQEMRDEAAQELEAAINSTKAHLQNKEVELATLHSPEDNEITRSQIADVKEVIADLEQRLVDLRGPLVDMQSALGGLAPAGGILGAAKGESAGETEARIEEAKKAATDLTGLVRKKGKTASAPSAGDASVVAGGSTKRKAEEELSIEEDASKKVRTEEATS
ncbi:hypothetical protein BD289DRAFT_249075 [Coniella lustricola]|uniref:Tetratricopeptide SHNi-TPR domain-containing protein n=1 Tax=Coniella lustricola TaxID=2025994 RepID=A0A2T3A8Y9_9PEZI|nr:hypothetical protein BD289DRAFT_249075 [Coniella lustricola]